MATDKRLSEVFQSAKKIPFDDNSKLIFFSDCHRGDNTWADDYAHNQKLHFHALQKYLEEGFTYIEIGDGDELYENRRFADIRLAHSHIFWLMREFFNNNRLYLIYGNHDIERRNPEVVKKTLSTFYDEQTQKDEPLFEGIEVHEGVILQHEDSEEEIFLVHGHQGDLINDQLAWLGRFFVRHVWRHLQLAGLKDPTSPAKNFRKRGSVERKIIAWVREKNQMTICGHTHRSVFPNQGEPLYFNTGSCVHPRCITGIEIVGGNIALIKWWNTPDPSGLIKITKETLEGPRKLADIWDRYQVKIRRKYHEECSRTQWRLNQRIISGWSDCRSSRFRL